MSFDVTAGVLELDDQGMSKSTGVLYPLAQFVVELIRGVTAMGSKPEFPEAV
jgi:hypothetical protein